MLLNLIMILVAILISIPLLVIAIELLIALFTKPITQVPHDFQGSYKILIPAHNESQIIFKTLSTLITSLVDSDSIIVVADNCTDDTAIIARDLGCTVLERFDEQRRGKGYALDYGLAFLKGFTHPDVLIVLDADCEISDDSLRLLSNLVISRGKPVQVKNLMRVVNETSFSQRIAGFAWLVKNKIRPIAVNKLGLPVTLTGTGMAFPWDVITNINVAHGNIVEDMQLGIDCTLMGFSPIFCEQAVVYSDFPEYDEAIKTQRTRWEHGHLLTIIQQVPKLLKLAILKRDWRLAGLALDIGVPPLSLLVLLSFVSVVLLAIISYWIESYHSIFILLVSVILFAVMLVATWWKSGREYLTLKELCCIPIYVVSKLFVYITFISKREKSWIRTSRERRK